MTWVIQPAEWSLIFRYAINNKVFKAREIYLVLPTLGICQQGRWEAFTQKFYKMRAHCVMYYKMHDGVTSDKILDRMKLNFENPALAFEFGHWYSQNQTNLTGEQLDRIKELYDSNKGENILSIFRRLPELGIKYPHSYHRFTVDFKY